MNEPETATTPPPEQSDRYGVTLTATYSPEDNKLRLYASARLPRELYDRVKAAGFSWAPQQELFVAPMWTPEREDILLDLCGEIGDEDKSLVERSEQRADRFEQYSENRAEDATRAREHVASITGGIPLGQPILIGHHSERHARRDAEKIQSGMRRAVKMWETSNYWTARAAGAIRSAKYKERPDVRARRIKKLEASLRKQQRNAERPKLNMWDFLLRDADGNPLKNEAGKLRIDGDKLKAAKAERDATPHHVPEWVRRWVAHYENRLAYERAMLAASGGTVSDRSAPEKGGACKCWVSDGRWCKIVKLNKVSVSVLDSWNRGGGDYFKRTVPFDKLSAVMSAAEVEAKRAAGLIYYETEAHYGFGEDPTEKDRPRIQTPAPVANDFDAMRETLRAGVHVVTAPQLFPTPAALAQRVVELADIEPGHRVLEPSAGTGALLNESFCLNLKGETVAVEINSQLAANIRETFPLMRVECADFLECNGNLGTFDRIVMNPPFSNGADIKHIQHAAGFLNPGGRLVAICAAGPRQREQLEPMASEWIALPAGSFEQAGTGVNTAIVIIEN